MFFCDVRFFSGGGGSFLVLVLCVCFCFWVVGDILLNVVADISSLLALVLTFFLFRENTSGKKNVGV